MTRHVDSPGIADAATEPDEHDDVMITDKMLNAGLEAYELFDLGDRPSWIVMAIYGAMERAKRNSS
jgi:hypothetical protein